MRILFFLQTRFFLLKIKVTFQVSYYWLEAKINVFSLHTDDYAEQPLLSAALCFNKFYELASVQNHVQNASTQSTARTRLAK